jgi:malate dehydrogenase (oxaloacetate-decarboxylating)
VTDGTRTLGLGSLGPEAALPVMEGKAVLYKQFGTLTPFRYASRPPTPKRDSENCQEHRAGLWRHKHIEDIETPKVLEIVDRLTAELDIPVFHDDQHGTAVVTLAALFNALRFTKRKPESTSVVVVVAGAGRLCRLWYRQDTEGDRHRRRGCHRLAGCPLKGKAAGDNEQVQDIELALITSGGKTEGIRTLAEAVKGKDVFIGVSGVKNLLTPAMVRSMSKDSIVFPLTNPDPEIHPKEAFEAGRQPPR